MTTTPRPRLRERVTVVIVTRNRAASLRRTLSELTGLPDAPPVIVVDDASSDGTAEVVRTSFPAVQLLRLERPEGPVARNHGIRRARTPYIALSDDDSWWAPGALARGVAALDAHPRVAIVSARILVGDDERVDGICSEMERGRLDGDPDVDGIPIISFMAGASVLRRAAFDEVGGFEPRLEGGGEEETLACDLLVAGWELRYMPDVVAHHHPVGGDKSRDRVLGIRNALWFAWRRRPIGSAVRWTWHMVRAAPRNRTTIRAVYEAICGVPWVLRSRRVIPAHVEAMMRKLDADKMSSENRRYG